MKLPFADELILVNLAYGGLIALSINILSNYVKITQEIDLVFLAVFAIGYTFLGLKDVI